MSSNSPHVPGRRQSGDVVHIHGLLNGLSRQPVPSVTTRTSRDAEEIKELNKLTPYQRTVYCALESLCGGQWSQSILEGAGLWELVQERGDDSHREALDVYRCQGLLKRLAGQRQLSEDELMRLNYALGHYTFLSGFWRRIEDFQHRRSETDTYTTKRLVETHCIGETNLSY